MSEPKHTKIIALLPVKNEAWVLPSYLSSMTRVADQIIALDDGSTDESADILKAAGVTVLTIDTTGEAHVNMSIRRQKLLEAGRAAGGTHFIWLDADEIFSANFIKNSNTTITSLQPGEGLSMRWVHLWKNEKHYLDDTKSPYGKLWKCFIVCDSPKMGFKDHALSESRTQEIVQKIIKVNEEDGVVLHFQFLNGKAMFYKHAWYRCQELLEGKRSARRINATYVLDYDFTNKFKTQHLPNSWTEGLVILTKENKNAWHRNAILKDFNKYGIEKFEPLDIWRYLPELTDIFRTKTGRMPQPTLFPKWLLVLNRLKNVILNRLKKLHKRLVSVLR